MAKTLQELNIADDFMFAKVMSDAEICRLILEKILSVKIKKVMILNEQVTIDILLDAKAIRLDVYIEDEKNTVYNIEMQQCNKDIERRSRYYSGVMDLDMIQKGCKYRDLKESYIIFICTFDLFKQGRHIYRFRNYCEQDKNLALEDGTHRVFLNTRGVMDDVDEEMKLFLRYVEDSTDRLAEESESALLKKVHNKVKEVKSNKRLEVEYMTLLEKYDEIAEEAEERGIERGIEQGREEGIEQGREEGIEQGIEKGIEKGMKKGIEQGIEQGIEKGMKNLVIEMLKSGVSRELIVKGTSIYKEQIEEWAKEIKE